MLQLRERCWRFNTHKDEKSTELDSFGRDLFKRGKHHLHQMNHRIHKRSNHYHQHCTIAIIQSHTQTVTHNLFRLLKLSHTCKHTQIDLYINHNPFTPSISALSHHPVLNHNNSHNHRPSLSTMFLPLLLKHIHTDMSITILITSIFHTFW